jgi:hypothetical protein
MACSALAASVDRHESLAREELLLHAIRHPKRFQELHAVSGQTNQYCASTRTNHQIGATLRGQ